jgi:hypothetical protein
MKKIVRLAESDLVKLIKKVIEEQNSSVVNKMSTISDSDWYKSFPCLNNKNRTQGLKFVGGKWMYKNSLLLPQSGKGDKNYNNAINNEPYNNFVGQIQGGGVYFCNSKYPEIDLMILK